MSTDLRERIRKAVDEDGFDVPDVTTMWRAGQRARRRRRVVGIVAWIAAVAAVALGVASVATVDGNDARSMLGGVDDHPAVACRPSWLGMGAATSTSDGAITLTRTVEVLPDVSHPARSDVASQVPCRIDEVWRVIVAQAADDPRDESGPALEVAGNGQQIRVEETLTADRPRLELTWRWSNWCASPGDHVHVLDSPIDGQESSGAYETPSPGCTNESEPSTLEFVSAQTKASDLDYPEWVAPPDAERLDVALTIEDATRADQYCPTDYPNALDEATWALRGEIVTVDDSVATWTADPNLHRIEVAVDEWLKHDPLVTQRDNHAWINWFGDLNTGIDGQSLQPGTDVLLAGGRGKAIEEGETTTYAWGCGFARPEDSATAQQWRGRTSTGSR